MDMRGLCCPKLKYVSFCIFNQHEDVQCIILYLFNRYIPDFIHFIHTFMIFLEKTHFFSEKKRENLRMVVTLIFPLLVLLLGVATADHFNPLPRMFLSVSPSPKHHHSRSHYHLVKLCFHSCCCLSVTNHT